ncbi:hypothetical protein SAMN04244548_02102 [Paracoccus pantotrophus]|nr:hypothetical protein SAMN04244548_02102 [Paracoccus pantotrophus]
MRRLRGFPASPGESAGESLGRKTRNANAEMGDGLARCIPDWGTKRRYWGTAWMTPYTI